jgi:glycosyltransferase involved in cell wall biosynthesis
LKEADAVISFDTASWILAERCCQLAHPFILDQSIGHPDAKQAAHDRMRGSFSEWDEGFEVRRPEVRAAEVEEQQKATAIVTASSFTKQTLVDHDVPEDKVHVIPYGVDSTRFIPNRTKTDRPFRFVFVGLITARKGIPLLLQAWRHLSGMGAELWLIGSASLQARALIPKLPGLSYFGYVAHVEKLLKECDVFVFPSFFEGFGLVILEAMACGLPVIATTATAGPDIITQNQDGWIIEPGNLDVLGETMRFCLENRDRITEMGANARRTAERFSWDAYGDRWIETLKAVMTA